MYYRPSQPPMAPRPAYASPSYPPVAGSMIPANPRRPKKSNAGLVIGLACGAFALVAVAGGAGAWAYAHRSPPVALPVDAALLPGQTSEIATQLIEATRETDEQVRRAYLAAELGSEICSPGTPDPARRIEELGSKTPRDAKDVFLDPKKREEIARMLECGSVLGATLERPYQTSLSFEDDDGKKQRVGVGHFTLDGAPRGPGYLPASYGTLPGFCRRKDGASTCDERDFGAFWSDKTWFFGSKSALETFAPSVRKPKAKLLPRVEAIKEAAEHTEGLPVMRIQASPKSSREFFDTPCLYGALQSAAPMDKFLAGCFPGKDADRALERMDSKLKAAAFEMDPDHQKAKAFRGNLVFVAKDDGAAKSLERDVNDVVSEWKSHVEENKAKLINESRELAHTGRQKKFAAVADAYFHAFERAKVTRKGRSVVVAFREELSAADLDALEDADRTTSAKRVATAAIVDALQGRKPLPEAALARLVGPAWAHYLASPPAAAVARVPMTESECRSIQDRLAGIALGDHDLTSEARTMYLTQKYASCSTRPPEADPTQRVCLSTFKTAADYSLCAGSSSSGAEPPASEYGDAKR